MLGFDHVEPGCNFRVVLGDQLTGHRKSQLKNHARELIMTDLITTDEVLFDDIVGLLDFSAPLTPRVFAGSSTDPAFSFTTPVVSRDATTKPITSDVRIHKREVEKKRQQRYRHKLKTLRDELQQQVDALTEKLHQLNEQKSRKKQLKSLHKTQQLTNSQWAQEADRQHGHRIYSEEENKKLLAAVHQQAEYIKRLQKVAGDLNDIPMRHSKTGTLYMTYLHQLEGCYARVDIIMDFYNMPSLQETTYTSTQRRQEDGEVSLYHHVTKVALPYSFDKTCEALWAVVHEQEKPAFGGYEIAPDDDVFIKSRVLTSMNVGQLAQRFISRFYKEKDRLILVWKMSSEGEGAFSGLHAEETAWMILRPTATGVMLEVCVQQMPMQLNISSNKEPEVIKFNNLLQESLEQDKQNMVAALGKLLLDDVLTGIEC